MAQSVARSKDIEVLRLLEEELRRLEGILGINDRLRVEWVPDGRRKLSGEVRGKTIFVYDRESESALETLRHELVDYLVCQAIQPYKEIANRLILFVNDRAYQEKEEMVEKLVRLFSPPD